MIEYFLNKHNKSVTVLQVQRLTGTLNFLCKYVIPGRVFLLRLYKMITNDKLMQHHHVRISMENRQDLLVWKKFLQHPQVFCRPFLDLVALDTTDIDMFSEASRNFSKGAGAYCGKNWCFVQWDRHFMEQKQPSIEFLELYGVAMAVLLWIRNFANKTINLFCDNKSTRDMINNSGTHCKNCMSLLRLIVLEGLVWNVKIKCKYVKSKENGRADALSRLDFKRFWNLDDTMNETPVRVPNTIWPLSKVWIN